MIREVAEKIREKGKVVAFTGAGISQASGIPPFRGEKGLWENYSPALYASVPGIISLYLLRPHSLSKFFLEILKTIDQAKPNPAHEVLAHWEKKGLLKGIITQNIDNLHRLAGNKNVAELHGNIYYLRCPACHRKIKISEETLKEIKELLEKGGRRELARIYSLLTPLCKCGRKLRLWVVFFGESLPQEEWDKAVKMLEEAETVLFLGTSGTVEPARSLPFTVKKEGALWIEINPTPTYFSSLVDYYLKGKVEEILPEIDRCLKI